MPSFRRRQLKRLKRMADKIEKCKEKKQNCIGCKFSSDCDFIPSSKYDSTRGIKLNFSDPITVSSKEDY